MWNVVSPRTARRRLISTCPPERIARKVHLLKKVILDKKNDFVLAYKIWYKPEGEEK